MRKCSTPPEPPHLPETSSRSGRPGASSGSGPGVALPCHPRMATILLTVARRSSGNAMSKRVANASRLAGGFELLQEPRVVRTVVACIRRDEAPQVGHLGLPDPMDSAEAMLDPVRVPRRSRRCSTSAHRSPRKRRGRDPRARSSPPPAQEVGRTTCGAPRAPLAPFGSRWWRMNPPSANQPYEAGCGRCRLYSSVRISGYRGLDSFRARWPRSHQPARRDQQQRQDLDSGVHRAASIGGQRARRDDHLGAPR